MIKDLVGQPLAIGDLVTFAESEYTEQFLGVIVKFTPKGMNIEYVKNHNPYRLDKCNRAGPYVIKIVDTTTPEVAAYLKKLVEFRLKEDFS